MAGDDFIECLLKCVEVKSAFKTKSDWHIVGVVCGPDLVQEPEALLNERDRQIAIAADRLKWHEFMSVRLALAGAELLNQNGNCWRIKQRGNGQFHIEALANA